MSVTKVFTKHILLYRPCMYLAITIAKCKLQKLNRIKCIKMVIKIMVLFYCKYIVLHLFILYRNVK